MQVYRGLQPGPHAAGAASYKFGKHWSSVAPWIGIESPNAPSLHLCTAPFIKGPGRAIGRRSPAAPGRGRGPILRSYFSRSCGKLGRQGISIPPHSRPLWGAPASFTQAVPWILVKSNFIALWAPRYRAVNGPSTIKCFSL